MQATALTAPRFVRALALHCGPSVLFEVGATSFFLIATLITPRSVSGTEFVSSLRALVVYATLSMVHSWLGATGVHGVVPDGVVGIEWAMWASLLQFSALTFDRWYALGPAASLLGAGWAAAVALIVVTNPSLRGDAAGDVLALWLGLPAAMLAAVTFAQIGARLEMGGRRVWWGGIVGGASFSALALLNGPLHPMARLSAGWWDRGIEAAALAGAGVALLLLFGGFRTTRRLRAALSLTENDDDPLEVAQVLERAVTTAARALGLSTVRAAIVERGGTQLRWFAVDAAVPGGRWWVEAMTADSWKQLRALPSVPSPDGGTLREVVVPLVRPRRCQCFELLDCGARRCPVWLGSVEDCWRVEGTLCRARDRDGMPACAGCAAFRIAGMLVGGRGGNGRPMTPAQIAQFSRIARQAAAGLDRALLAEEAAGHHRALKSTNRSLQVLEQSARLFASTLDRSQLGDLIVHECARALPSADAIALRLVDDGNGRLTLVATHGAMDRVRAAASVEEEALARQALQITEPELRSVQAAESGFGLVRRDLGPASCLLVPLRHQERPVGVISLFRFDAREMFTPADCDLVKAIAALAAIALENSDLHTDALRAAATDSLTGLHNHGSFFKRLDEEMAAATRSGCRLALMMVDLDHFKGYNDRRGHLAGDRALIAVARVLQRNLRASDVVCRYGGEEFAVILPGTGLRAAYLLAEKLRAQAPQQLSAEVGEDLTVSIGLAAFDPARADAPSFVHAADELLFQAKRGGRNRTCILGEESAP